MSWANKSYTFVKNLRYFSTSTVKYYIPLVGSLAEKTDATNAEVNFAPPSSGRIARLDFISNASPGTTIITLEDELAGTLGTVSFTWAGSGVLNTLNFPDDLDSGTNEFNGLGRIRIGVDVAASAGNGEFAVTFGLDL